MVFLGMGRSKRPEAVDILIRHLDDPVVSGHTVKALGMLRDPRARAGLESMTADRRTWVREAAERPCPGSDEGVTRRTGRPWSPEVGRTRNRPGT
ncbi:HEAT repeat domain-containing protein [Arthrobacter humicola]